MARRLDDQQLANLEQVVEGGSRYLVFRTDDVVERVYKMHYPSYNEQQMAAIEQHKYRSELGKDKSLRSRRQIEKEYAADLKELRKELSGHRKELEKAEIDFIENEMTRADFPDAEADPEGFQKAIEKRAKQVAKIQDNIWNVTTQIDEILAYSVEALAAQHRLARLTQVCWERAGENVEWEPIWKEWEEFATDQRTVPRRLLLETRIWLEGGAIPFVS